MAEEEKTDLPNGFLGSPQDDPAYKKAKAIQEMKARKARRTKCCNNHNKPHDQKKNKQERKDRRKNKK